MRGYLFFIAWAMLLGLLLGTISTESNTRRTQNSRVVANWFPADNGARRAAPDRPPAVLWLVSEAKEIAPEVKSSKGQDADRHPRAEEDQAATAKNRPEARQALMDEHVEHAQYVPARTEKAVAPTSPMPLALWGAVGSASPRIAGDPDALYFDTAGADQHERFWASADYLLWWLSAGRFPPLVTTGPPGSGGILGRPGTSILLGDSDLGNPVRSGGRYTAGCWLDCSQSCGLESSTFFLGQQARVAQLDSTSFPVLARPFFNLNTGAESSEVATTPGLATGHITVARHNDLWGTELNLRQCCCRTCWFACDFLAGFRTLQMNENLEITESLQALPGGSPFGGSQILVNDRFGTHNEFYGGQVGGNARLRRGRWDLDFLGKIAVGGAYQAVEVQGSQRITSPSGAVATFMGGLLALPSNLGLASRNRFAVVPELGLNAGCRLTEHVRVFVGYTFLYWSSVARPGDQIDRALDVTQVPNFPTAAVPTGQARPALTFREADLWAQGVNFGCEFHY